MLTGLTRIFWGSGFHRGRYHTNRPRRTLMWSYSSEHFATYDYFSDQPWLLEPNYLDGLSEGCRTFFRRYIDAFEGRMRARGGGDYERYADQVAAQMERHNAARL